jgi:hypothetical protein
MTESEGAEGTTTTETSETEGQQNGESPDTGTAELDALRSELAKAISRAEDAERDRDKWKTSSRKHEERSRAVAEDIRAKKSLEQQVAELQQQMAERDTADRERSARHALAQLRAEVAESGIPGAAVDGFPIDVNRLLDEQGQPDDKAIREAAKSLVKFAGRTTPDPDQGRTGGLPKNDMDSMIRRAAGFVR